MKPEILVSLIGTLVTAVTTIIVAWIHAQSKKTEQSSTILVPEGYRIHRPKAYKNWIFVVPIALFGGIMSYLAFSLFFPPSQTTQTSDAGLTHLESTVIAAQERLLAAEATLDAQTMGIEEQRTTPVSENNPDFALTATAFSIQSTQIVATQQAIETQSKQIEATQTAIAPPINFVLDNLDEEASLWGVFAEGSPLWQLENVSSPSLDGRSLKCSITGGSPYSNVHCYENLLFNSEATTFIISFSFWISPPTTCNNLISPSVVQGLEFSISRFYKSVRHEFAMQWDNVDTGAPKWRYWSGSDWAQFSPSINQCLQGEEWHTFILRGRIEGEKAIYETFRIDNQEYNLSLTGSSASAPGEPDRISITVQLDGNFKQEPYDLYIDKLTLTSLP